MTSLEEPEPAPAAHTTPTVLVLAGVPTSPGVGSGPVAHLPAGGPPGRPGSVVVAADVTPAQMAVLTPATVAAVATAAGAPLSHAAILARSLGLPVVTGLGPDLMAIRPGTPVLVDGDAGTVHVDPPVALVQAAAARAVADRRHLEDAVRRAMAPAVTCEGCTVPVLVNVGDAAEARTAVAGGADGVGMLRTEFTFLDRADAPAEDEQYRAYHAVADAIGVRPLVVRTLDLGADIPAWGSADEPNPALGNRGVRFSLATPRLLETQLRAIARLAADRPVRVMFPMVTTVDEVHAARACLDRIAGVAGTRSRIEVGITVEVPAAALTADALAPLVDFFAIGTNDLTQYTLAADRANAAVAGLADGMHPAVLRLISEVTAAGDRHGRAVEVVGELACDPLAVGLLIGLGVTELSVRPNAVPVVKQAVRTIRLDGARALAKTALDATSATAVRRLCLDAKG
ncbi:MAG TPA: putative PEP-binding protein [Acidimicrobiales bacterium]|nr:putative PEP-binding protein [Acidimicrobiales bacterium]